VILSWRLVHARYAAHVFDGEGARLYGGRWNSPGRPVVYTAGSLALAALEVLVHIQSRKALTNYLKVRLEFEESLVLTVPVSSLPPHWHQGRAAPETRAVGDRWFDAGTTPILGVPSVVVPEEWNYMLNPRHPQFDEIHRGQPEPFPFDPRLR
jgi:RES domain-containing protein